ncbi:MAG: hypothetical protein OEV55_09785, partial [candidate division Zixibacteria bacterium]|nr:hypothetical protein [candidate division Zixibacteria bacterium]
MKSFKSICFLLGGVFIFFASLFASEKETTQQQTYTPQVIINAHWGNKPGEFGLYDPYRSNPDAYDQGPIQGPSTFTIAPNGDIYIVDTFKHRIQRFNQNGPLVSVFSAVGSGWVEDIAVDASGYIYLLYLGPPQVWKSDQEGNRLEIFNTFYLQNTRERDENARGMSIRGGSTRLY